LVACYVNLQEGGRKQAVINSSTPQKLIINKKSLEKFILIITKGKAEANVFITKS